MQCGHILVVTFHGHILLILLLQYYFFVYGIPAEIDFKPGGSVWIVNGMEMTLDSIRREQKRLQKRRSYSEIINHYKRFYSLVYNSFPNIKSEGDVWIVNGKRMTIERIDHETTALQKHYNEVIARQKRSERMTKDETDKEKRERECSIGDFKKIIFMVCDNVPSISIDSLGFYVINGISKTAKEIAHIKSIFGRIYEYSEAYIQAYQEKPKIFYDGQIFTINGETISEKVIESRIEFLVESLFEYIKQKHRKVENEKNKHGNTIGVTGDQEDQGQPFSEQTQNIDSKIESFIFPDEPPKELLSVDDLRFFVNHAWDIIGRHQYGLPAGEWFFKIKDEFLRDIGFTHFTAEGNRLKGFRCTVWSTKSDKPFVCFLREGVLPANVWLAFLHVYMLSAIAVIGGGFEDIAFGDGAPCVSASTAARSKARKSVLYRPRKVFYRVKRNNIGANKGKDNGEFEKEGYAVAWYFRRSPSRSKTAVLNAFVYAGIREDEIPFGKTFVIPHWRGPKRDGWEKEVRATSLVDALSRTVKNHLKEYKIQRNEG